MNIFIIVLTALWLYPLLGYIIYRLTQRRPIIQKTILWSLIVLNLIVIVGLTIGISTLSTEINWIIITTIYLTISLLFWILQDNSNKFIKVITIIFMILTFSFGFLMGSIGALGTAFIIGEYEPKLSLNVTSDLTYKEYTLGNVLTDYRGKRIEIDKKITVFPILHRLIIKKEYYDIDVYADKLNVNYSEDKNILILSTKQSKNYDNCMWSDTIKIK